VLPRFLLLAATARGLLARIVGLRWARVGRFDLVVPAAIAAAVWTAVPQLGTELAGVPFGVAWIALTAAVVVPLLLRSRARGGATSVAAGSAPARLPALGLILVVGIVVSWVLYDVWFWGHTNQLYDLDVYLGSAGRWLDGARDGLAVEPRLGLLPLPPAAAARLRCAVETTRRARRRRLDRLPRCLRL
jgi:predicted secreted protein